MLNSEPTIAFTEYIDQAKNYNKLIDDYVKMVEERDSKIEDLEDKLLQYKEGISPILKFTPNVNDLRIIEARIARLEGMSNRKVYIYTDAAMDSTKELTARVTFTDRMEEHVKEILELKASVKHYKELAESYKLASLL